MSRTSFILSCAISLIVFGETEAQFIRHVYSDPIQPGARAAALADAYISDPCDVNSMYWNPASLAFLHTYSIAANSTLSMDNSIFKNSVAVPYRVGKDQTAAIGIGASYVGYFEFHSLDLGYSKKILPSLSAGIFIDLGYAANRSDGKFAGSGSLGILYAPSPSVSYAAVYKGIGTRVHYSFDGINEFLEYTETKRAILIGTSFWFPTLNRQPFLNVSLAVEKIFGEGKFISKAGIEIWPQSFIATRIGIVAGPKVATGRIGFGVRINPFRFDYAVSPSVAEERFHHISISFSL